MLGKTAIINALAGVTLLVSGAALAAPLSPADRNTIQQQQQQLLDENQRQREELERSAIVPRPVTPDDASTPQGPCFVISNKMKSS
jgi:hemolysin activation/secretion protein